MERRRYRRTVVGKRSGPEMTRAMRRRAIKLILCLLLSAAALLIKFAFPDLAERLAVKIIPAIEGDLDYTSAIASIGEALNIKADPDKEDKKENENTELDLINLPEEGKGSSAAALEDISLNALYFGLDSLGSESEQPDVVAAFLGTQEEFASLKIPENVDYSLFDLPFETTAPATGEISSLFGYRMHPLSETVQFHYGTDIAAQEESPVYAFAGGKVQYSGDSASYGLFVVVAHQDGYRTLYAHCDEILVSSGDNISAGEQIATVGDSGEVTGACLHFELTKDGCYINPGYYI